jgi:hypothetical protein
MDAKPGIYTDTSTVANTRPTTRLRGVPAAQSLGSAGAMRPWKPPPRCGHSALAPSAHGGRPPDGSPRHRPAPTSAATLLAWRATVGRGHPPGYPRLGDRTPGRRGGRHRRAPAGQSVPSPQRRAWTVVDWPGLANPPENRTLGTLDGCSTRVQQPHRPPSTTSDQCKAASLRKRLATTLVPLDGKETVQPSPLGLGRAECPVSVLVSYIQVHRGPSACIAGP